MTINYSVRGLLMLLLACGPAVTVAQTDDGTFGRCVESLQVRAREEGINDSVVEDVLGNVKRVERIIELDRNQPEFTRTFADYYNRRVTDQRVERGHRLREENRDLLDTVQQRYGVPSHYLLSFWGLETNFGAIFGKIPTPDALATLACDPRRSGFFSEELMSALRIIDTGDADGVFGPATSQALSRFQKSRGAIADGHLDAEAIAAVRDATSGGQ